MFASRDVYVLIFLVLSESERRHLVVARITTALSGGTRRVLRAGALASVDGQCVGADFTLCSTRGQCYVRGVQTLRYRLSIPETIVK
jgi:hypothetical protein